MNNIIMLIRKTDDDIDSIKLTEFLKFTGCIVSEFTVAEAEKVNFGVCGRYQAYVLQDIQKKDILEGHYPMLNTLLQEEGKILELVRNRRHESKTSMEAAKAASVPSELDCKDGDTQVMGNLIPVVGKNDEERTELSDLMKAFNQNKLFYFLYNEGNLKFVREYYPAGELYDSNRRIVAQEERKQCYHKSFSAFANCYNSLVKFRKNSGRCTHYCDYASLLLKYKMNEMSNLLEGENVFGIQSMIEDGMSFLKKYPWHARMRYLLARIYQLDPLYWMNVESYYEAAIKQVEEENESGDAAHFLYYQLGRFYEKARKRMVQADLCYEKAYQLCPLSYRALYKKIMKAQREERWQDVVKSTNQLLKLILNGYELKNVKPKQLIYAYKSYQILGDAYAKRMDYYSADECYQMALKISRLEPSEIRFYSFAKGDDNLKPFLSVFQTCVSEKPVQYKIWSILGGAPEECYEK